MARKRLLISAALCACVSATHTFAAEYVSNGFFETGIDGWQMWNGADNGATMERNSGTHFDGQGCLMIVNPISDAENQWKVQIHTDFTTPLPTGDYELSYYIRTLSGEGSVRVSTSGEANYQADQNVSATYTKKILEFTVKEQGGVDGFNFDIAHTANTYFIDNVVLTPINITGDISGGGEDEEATVSIDATKTHQTIEGIGGGLVYYQGWAVAHKNRAAIFDTLFNGLGVSAIRLGNWLQNLEDGMADDIAVQEEAEKRIGRENYIIEMSSWAAPAELKSNGDINGPYPLKKVNGKFVYEEYAEWWKQSLKKYMDNGIRPDYISMQNEPDMAATYAATLFDPCENYVDYTGKQFDNSGYAEALPIFCSKIREIENAPKILGPEVLGIGYNNTQNYMGKLDASLLDGLAFHYYHSGENASDRYSEPDKYLKAQKGLVKDYPDMPQFMTENCAMRNEIKGDAVHTAWIIANGMNANNLAAYFHWNLLWGDADGCVTVYNPWSEGEWKTADGFKVNEEYHGLRHFTKFVQKGWKRIEFSCDNSDLVCAAFISPNGKQASAIIINKGRNKHSVMINSPFKASKAYLTITCGEAGQWSEYKGKTDLKERVEMPGMSIVSVMFEIEDNSDIAKHFASETLSVSFADGDLIIRSDANGNANIELWDVTGKVWANRQVGLYGETRVRIGDLASGVYFVKVRDTEGKTQTTKLLIK